MGEGTVSGGSYARIKVFGEAGFMDGVEAENITIFGNADVREVVVNKMTVFGNGRFKGAVQAKELRVNGEADFSQRVKADRVVINGSLQGTHGLDSEKFVSRGAFDLDYLNANDVEIFLWGRSRVKEIGAETVRVQTRSWFMFFHNLFGRQLQALEAETIEADRIYLEKTVAESVRGNEVRIGPGCKIKTVEYKDFIWIDPDAQVEQTVQI